MDPPEREEKENRATEYQQFVEPSEELDWWVCPPFYTIRFIRRHTAVIYVIQFRTNQTAAIPLY